jgi:hypothetical protein
MLEETCIQNVIRIPELDRLSDLYSYNRNSKINANERLFEGTDWAQLNQNIPKVGTDEHVRNFVVNRFI